MNATRSWHMPQELPRKISVIDIVLAPAFAIKGAGWQFEQSSQSVWERCGNRTKDISFVFFMTISRSRIFIFSVPHRFARGAMAPELNAAIQSGKPRESRVRCRVASSMRCSRKYAGFVSSYIAFKSIARRVEWISLIAGTTGFFGATTGTTLGAGMNALNLMGSVAVAVAANQPINVIITVRPRNPMSRGARWHRFCCVDPGEWRLAHIRETHARSRRPHLLMVDCVIKNCRAPQTGCELQEHFICKSAV